MSVLATPRDGVVKHEGVSTTTNQHHRKGCQLYGHPLPPQAKRPTHHCWSVGLSAPVSGANVPGVYLPLARRLCPCGGCSDPRRRFTAPPFQLSNVLLLRLCQGCPVSGHPRLKQGCGVSPHPLCVTWHYTRKRFPPPASASACDRPRFFVAGFCSGPTDRRPCCRCHDLPGFPRLVAFDFPLFPLHLYLTHAIQRDYEPVQGVFGSLVDGAGVSKPQLVR